MDKVPVCSSSSSAQPLTQPSTEVRKNLKKRGLRVDAEPFIPEEVAIRFPCHPSTSAKVRSSPLQHTLNKKNESDSTFLSSPAPAKQEFSPSKESVVFGNDVVLNKVAIPDNVASNENLLLDFLGEAGDSEDLDDYCDNVQQMRTPKGAYWGAVGPRIPTHYYTRQIGAASFLSTSADNLTEYSEDMQPLSSIQSVVDLDHDFEDFDSSFSDSLDSEQIGWVEEQLVAGNPKTDGYFK